MGALVVTLVACSSEVVFDEGSGGAAGATSAQASSTGSGDDCGCAVGAYVPVCGVDGNTYDAACGRHCVPVAIACQGECPCDECALLEQEYVDTLAEAKACMPELTVEQCDLLVDEELSCPCTGTFVSTINQDAVAKLEALKNEFVQKGCDENVACDLVLCEQFQEARCDSVSSSCVDGG
jgi:hypothetical protein